MGSFASDQCRASLPETLDTQLARRRLRRLNLVSAVSSAKSCLVSIPAGNVFSFFVQQQLRSAPGKVLYAYRADAGCHAEARAAQSRARAGAWPRPRLAGELGGHR